jgi:lipopolysaccharide export system protein LptA
MKALGFLLTMAALLCPAQDAVKVPVLPKPLEQPPQRLGLEIGADITTFSNNIVVYKSLGTNFVVVTYPVGKSNEPPAIMWCRKLTGKRLNNRQFDFIEAEGDVQMMRGDQRAYGQRAIYFGTNELVVLTGEWKGPPMVWPRPFVCSQCNTYTNKDGSTYEACLTNTADTITYERLKGVFTFNGNQKTYVPTNFLNNADLNSSRAPATLPATEPKPNP